MRKAIFAAVMCGCVFAGAQAQQNSPDVKFDFENETVGDQPKSFVPIVGNFADRGVFHPMPQTLPLGDEPIQMFGDVWEWTQSAYLPYPGYRPLPGAVGEYNGKFMCNQFVLRGGSCATPVSHIRASYRNFFPPNARWQFMGIRLAK
jgi:formylglycine-generating enzyme required for sulfatase activity